MEFGSQPSYQHNDEVWYLMGALDTALKEYDALLVENSAATTKSIHKILRLFEAALNIQCRVRLAPTELQIKLDQLAHKDIIRVMAIAVGAISFTEFALEVLAIPSVNGKESGVELVSKSAIAMMGSLERLQLPMAACSGVS